MPANYFPPEIYALYLPSLTDFFSSKYSTVETGCPLFITKRSNDELLIL